MLLPSAFFPSNVRLGGVCALHPFLLEDLFVKGVFFMKYIYEHPCSEEGKTSGEGSTC